MTFVSDYVMERVAQEGVRHVFLIPGGGCMHLVDALGRHPQLEPIAMLHEQGAAIAADAYGQLREGLGVALVTTGPGSTNAITGVAAAWLDSTPLLIISGQVKTADLAVGKGIRQLGFQEIDITSVVEPITKLAKRVDNPADIPTVLDQAITAALTGRPGPVWVDIPLDVQAAEIEVEHLETAPSTANVPPEQVRLAAIDLIAELRSATRPVVLAGNGVRLARGTEDLLAFVELTRIPMLLTWKALDFLPVRHPLNAGRPGAVASRYANFTQQTSDVFVGIGARFDFGQTAYRPENIAPHAKKTFVDIDSHELKKLNQAGGRLLECDAGVFLSLLLEEARKHTWPDFGSWHSRITTWKHRYPLGVSAKHSGFLETYDVVRVLSDEMKDDDLFVPGSSGACSEVSMQAFENKPGQRVFNSEGLGPMGFGIAAPIGASCLRPEANIYSIDGDGGFQMNVQELEVASRRCSKICWIVLDNDGYGSIKVTQDGYFQGRRVASDPDSGLTLPDASSVAAAYGLISSKVNSEDELRSALVNFKKNPRPTVIVAKVNPDHRTEPRVASRRLEDGSMESDPMEDLSPKLDRSDLLRELS
jgi:acetolactate synthase-1/2/3 large subunit